jgi:Fe-S cluster biosynthesis and repair protein YggX
MVQCAKLGKELEGLEKPPLNNELGKRIYEHVSKTAWAMWVDHQKMVINEYGLIPADPQAQKILMQAMEQFFFGEGAEVPPDYVAPPEGE